MTPTRQDSPFNGSTALRWLLRGVGFVSCTALVPAVMPLEWMHSIHGWLGLGQMPEGPIVEYLARSTSGAYTILGVFLLLFSSDLPKYRTAIFFAAATVLGIGLGLGAFHLGSGMPLYWRIGEPFFCLFLGMVVLVLNLRFNRKI
jgi:hypothetical protein